MTQICWRCNGEGRIYQPGYSVDIYERCDECNGKGNMEDDYEDEDDGQAAEQLANFFGKFKYEVCPRCSGHGKHVNPAIDGHGLSREDFDEDPDFKEDYFSGVYDVACYECKGERVVKAPDWLAMTPGEAHALHSHLEEEAEYAALCRAERRAECGWDYGL